MSAFQPDLFSPVLFLWEWTARMLVTERRWSSVATSYKKTVVVWVVETCEAPDADTALAQFTAGHPTAQTRGLINHGPAPDNQPA